MSEWGIGFAAGIIVGLVIGFVTGMRRKSWSEMTAKEKRLRMWLIGGGVILLAAAAVAAFLVM